MSATDELRRLLDERGVEWEPVDGCAATYVEYNGEAWRFDYDEPFDQLGIVCISGYTPEQAIDATLGRGTCHAIEVPMGIHDDATATVCSACRVAIDELSEMNYCPNCGARVVDA